MKQNQYKNNFFSFMTVAITALVCMTSCDTEYNTTYVSGDADIKSFTVQEFEDQQPIQAAIVNDTIKILWVSYHDMPETITPTIVLSDKAAISPKAAVEIPFKTGEKYTVTSEAGTTKQYTLEVDFRQPQPKTAIFSTGGTIGGSSAFVYSIAGSSIDNLWFNLEQTRVYLVSAADKTTEYDCDIAYFGDGKGSNPFMNTGLYYYLPTNVPVGKYDLRIKNGEYIVRSATEANWFNFTITEPIKVALSQWNPSSYTVKGGDTFSVRGTKLDTGVKVSIAIGNNGEQMPLEIVSRTAYKATFKVPVGTPAGAYNRIFFIDENGVAVRVSKQIDVIE